MTKVLVTFGFIAAVVILVAFLVPDYSDYTTRSQVSEGLNLAGGAKAAVVEYAQDHGSYPETNEDAGIQRPSEIFGKYVTSVSVQKNTVTATYGNDADTVIDGQRLILTVSKSRDGDFTWECRSPSIPRRHLPSVCRHEP
jgi:type IV pilus assembly protein PilA